MERIALLALRHPGWTLLLSIVITLATAGCAFLVKVNNDPRKLPPASYPSLRWLERGKTPREIGLTQVGKSVLSAGLATLVGFGSLILSGYPGLQSMGVVALLGVGFSFLLSMTPIPVLLQGIFSKKIQTRIEGRLNLP